MGSIIGTSITGWIICLAELGDSSGALSLLSTETISAIAAIIGILLKMAAKNKRVKQTGDILLGFAVIMFGMKTMSSSVPVIISATGSTTEGRRAAFSYPIVEIRKLSVQAVRT